MSNGARSRRRTISRAIAARVALLAVLAEDRREPLPRAIRSRPRARRAPARDPCACRAARRRNRRSRARAHRPASRRCPGPYRGGPRAGPRARARAARRRSCRAMKRVAHGDLARRTRRSAPRPAGRGRCRSARRVDAEPVGHQPRVAARAERAVDGERARGRVERFDQLARQDGDVRACHVEQEVSPADCHLPPPARRSKPLGDLAPARRAPAAYATMLAAPDLDRVVVADQRHLLVEAGVLDQGLRKHDAPGRVELGVEGARVESGAEGRARPRRTGRGCRGSARCAEASPLIGQIETQGSSALARMTPSERAPAELGRDREPVLRVQRVLELPQKRQARKLSLLRVRDLGWRGGRNPAIPVRFNVGPTLPHSSPQCNTSREIFPLRALCRAVDGFSDVNAPHGRLATLTALACQRVGRQAGQLRGRGAAARARELLDGRRQARSCRAGPRGAIPGGCPERSRSTHTRGMPMRAAGRMSCIQLQAACTQSPSPTPARSRKVWKWSRSGL